MFVVLSTHEAAFILTAKQELTITQSRKRSSSFWYDIQFGALFDSCHLGKYHLPPSSKNADEQRRGRETARTIVGQLGLVNVIDQYPAELSGGMQKRVA